MKVESLNCPNCGAAVSSDAPQCLYCHSRLKTMACPGCFSTMFLGSLHCPKCGAKSVQPQIDLEEKSRSCPRCRIKMNWLQIETTILLECEKCGGLWSSVEAFETICLDRERQAVLLNLTVDKRAMANNIKPAAMSYVPCPECGQLMNRSNYARSSGVLIDSCKQHGVWFDSDELPRIIEFVRAGGLDRARAKEKVHLEEQKSGLRGEQFRLAAERNRFGISNEDRDSDSGGGLKDILDLLFE